MVPKDLIEADITGKFLPNYFKSFHEITEESTVTFKPRRRSTKAEKDEKDETLVEEKVVIRKKKRKSIVEEDVVSPSEIRLPRRKSSYAVDESVEETFQVNLAKSIAEDKQEICEEESFDFKVRRKSSVPTFHRQGICDFSDFCVASCIALILCLLL